MPLASTTTVNAQQNQNEAFSTEARIRQKERLKKEKEAGRKPKKRIQTIEPGCDDCGDDLRGLGKDIVLLSSDAINEDPNCDNDEDIFLMNLPLCYGYDNKADIIEIGETNGKLSQAMLISGLTSGGYVSQSDLGNPTIQESVMHYIETCDVLVAIIHLGDNDDMSYLSFCGQVAMKQKQQGRYYLSRQPAGKRIDYEETCS